MKWLGWDRKTWTWLNYTIVLQQQSYCITKTLACVLSIITFQPRPKP